MIQIAELAYQASMLVWAVAGLVLLPLLAVCGGLVLFHKTRAYGGVALWLFSWLVGLSTWLLGAAFTLRGGAVRARDEIGNREHWDS